MQNEIKNHWFTNMEKEKCKAQSTKVIILWIILVRRALWLDLNHFYIVSVELNSDSRCSRFYKYKLPLRVHIVVVRVGYARSGTLLTIFWMQNQMWSNATHWIKVWYRDSWPCLQQKYAYLRRLLTYSMRNPYKICIFNLSRLHT